MKNFKKALLMGLSFVLVAALAIGGTLAYLTSEDSDVNVMTLGKVSIKQNEQQLADDGVTLEPFEQAKGIYPGTDVSKIVTVENTGESDLYFRTLVAFEDLPNSETFGISFPIGEFSGYTWSWGAPAATIVIDGVTYQVYEARYNSVLKSGETSPASLTKVEFDATCTNEDMIALGDTYEILVLSQAVQAKGFENAQTALNEGFGSVAEKAAEWFGGIKVPIVVSTADQLAAALTNGGEVILAADIDADADTTITIAEGVTSTLNLNGHTLEFVTDDADKNGDGKITSADNEVAIDVRGTLNVKNGTITTKHTAENFGWNGCTEVFYVAFNGTLNVENATIENLGGSDMAYAIDLVNAKNVTLNIKDSVIKSTYIPVRVFNNGSGMNNVTIKDSTLDGVSRAFWVHIYSNKDNGGRGVKDATLNLDIFGNGNTFNASNPNRIIEFGFEDEINFDANGNQL